MHRNVFDFFALWKVCFLTFIYFIIISLSKQTKDIRHIHYRHLNGKNLFNNDHIIFKLSDDLLVEVMSRVVDHMVIKSFIKSCFRFSLLGKRIWTNHWFNVVRFRRKCQVCKAVYDEPLNNDKVWSLSSSIKINNR